MNKKLFLLPILSLSLLAGCAGKPASQSTSQSGSQSQSESGSGSQGQKEIWEEDEVEGESTIAQVKAGAAEQYYTVRGTVVANSGSTLAIYRKGQFLYCYNFKAGEHEGLENHPLGAYVEIHAQSSVYSDSVQLTAYDVGTEKTDAKYDKAATLKVLKEKGETVAPVKVSTAEGFSNANGAGMLMEVEFVPGEDLTLSATDDQNNQEVKGTVGETEFTIRMEKYLPNDVKAALIEANTDKFEDHATYKVVALGAATSSGNVRGLLVEGSSWSKTKDAQFAEPTAVSLDCTENEVEVGAKLTLDWEVEPENAKQAVTFTSSDDTIATVSEKGVVLGVAPGEVTITAAATAKPSVTATFDITVKAAVVNYTSVGALSFNKNTKVTITDELSDGTDPKITYAENGVSIVVRKNTSSSPVNVWKSDYASCRWYVGNKVDISSETAFKRVVLTCDSSYDVFKDSAEGVIDNVSGGASVSYDKDSHLIILELATAATSLTIVPDKQIRPSNVELFKVA